MLIQSSCGLQNEYFITIFTARKQSLRRLCFYTCLSFCSQGGYPKQVHPLAGTPPSRYTPRQVHPLGRYTIWAGTPPGRYTHPLAGTPQAGTFPGRYTPWAGTPHGRYTPQAGTPPGQVAPQAGTPPDKYTPQAGTTPSNACWDTVNKRAVRILLECILLSGISIWLRKVFQIYLDHENYCAPRSYDQSTFFVIQGFVGVSCF